MVGTHYMVISVNGIAGVAPDIQLAELPRWALQPPRASKQLNHSGRKLLSSTKVKQKFFPVAPDSPECLYNTTKKSIDISRGHLYSISIE